MDEIENDFYLFVLKFNFEVNVKSTSFVILLTSVRENENWLGSTNCITN